MRRDTSNGGTDRSLWWLELERITKRGLREVVVIAFSFLTVLMIVETMVLCSLVRSTLRLSILVKPEESRRNKGAKPIVKTPKFQVPVLGSSAGLKTLSNRDLY